MKDAGKQSWVSWLFNMLLPLAVEEQFFTYAIPHAGTFQEPKKLGPPGGPTF
jgi:hypothetical protein